MVTAVFGGVVVVTAVFGGAVVVTAVFVGAKTFCIALHPKTTGSFSCKNFVLDCPPEDKADLQYPPMYSSAVYSSAVSSPPLSLL